MSDIPLLFPYLDVAMRVIAVLILCALPLLLMPASPPDGALRRSSKPTPPLTTTD